MPPDGTQPPSELVTVASFDPTHPAGTWILQNVSAAEALDLIDPPRMLNDELRAELLALCHETDESIGKIGMAQFHTFLRADLETLIETLRDRPASLEDARAVVSEFLEGRDSQNVERTIAGSDNG